MASGPPDPENRLEELGGDFAGPSEQSRGQTDAVGELLAVAPPETPLGEEKTGQLATVPPPSHPPSPASLQIATQMDSSTQQPVQTLPARSTDESPVLRMEKAAWWFASFAAEPFSAAGIGLFCTVLVESLAAQAGFQSSDPSQPCDTSVQGYDCSVMIGGWTVNTTSVVLYATALSVIIQLLTFLTLGPQADFGGRRKLFMLLFGWLGAASALLFFGATTPSMWPLATIGLIFATLGLSTFYIFSNAYLPILARYDPLVIDAVAQNAPDQVMTYERAINTMSTHGIAISSAGGFLGIGVSVGALAATGMAQESIAYACGTMGVWWAFFLIFPLLKLKVRPGNAWPAGENPLFLGWKRLWHTILRASKLKNLMIYLGFWFALSDAIAVISSVSVLFAQVSLGFGTTDLIILSLILPVAAIVGSYGFLLVARVGKLSLKHVLLIITLGFLILPIWGLAGLHTIAEFYALAVLYGLFLGGTMATARSAYAEMLPAGMEAELFALFGVTDKASSFVGPLIVGAIANSTGSTRQGFWYILGILIVALGLGLLWNQAKGRDEAAAFVEQQANAKASLEEAKEDVKDMVDADEKKKMEEQVVVAAEGSSGTSP